MRPLIKLALPVAVISAAGAWILGRSPESGHAPPGDAATVSQAPTDILAPTGMSATLGNLPTAVPAVPEPEAETVSPRQPAPRLRTASRLVRRPHRSPAAVEPAPSANSVPPPTQTSSPAPLATNSPPRTPQRPAEESSPVSMAPPETVIALGVGLDRYPRWLGAARPKTEPVPYINVNWQDRVEFSTVDGLLVDVIHGENWHGGLVGTMMWGRSTADLEGLSRYVPTLANTLQAGAYLEYAFSKQFTIGARLRRDIQPTRAVYGDIYAELDLPTLEPFEHSLRFSLESMNQAAMRRYFGVSQETALGLGTSSYQPGGGLSQAVINYSAFLPTSEHTGIAVSVSYGRLGHLAADSPLVRNFGDANQKNVVAAFLYHF